jgi:hypothetical protein
MVTQLFTFAGTVTADGQGAPQFRQDLLGSGHIELSLSNHNPDPGGSCGGFRNCAEILTYFFESPTAPIPEPGTMLLLGSALGGFAALRRKKQ